MSENTVQAAGLYTYVSELIAPEGSQKIADNVNIDEKGVITPRRGFNDFGQEIGETSTRHKQVMQYKNRLIRHYEQTLEFENLDETFTAFDGSYQELEEGFRIKNQEMNSNLYFTTDKGVKKISAKSGKSLSSSPDFIVGSGAPKAVDLRAKVLPNDTGFLPPQSKVAYKILFGYKDNNNNLILGAPSTRFVTTNTSQDITTSEEVQITFSGVGSDYASKYFLLDGLNDSYFIWYNTGTDTIPQDASTLNRTPVEINIDAASNNQEVAAITANNITNLQPFNIDLDFASALITLTSTEEGNIPDAQEGTLATELNIVTTIQGDVTTGTNSNVEVEFIIPQGVGTNYFYQIYRTAIVTKPDGLEITDIDPGEDANLVFEAPVSNVPGTIVTVEDITPDSFRATGTPLYNNPISGEGILQANNQPPIAKDLELYQNFMFYANTKNFHRYETTIVSIDDFVSGQTQFILGNSEITRSYTFVGTQEVNNITTGTVADTLETNVNDSYITINSANDERQFYIWFDKGTGVDPKLTNRIGIRVDLTGSNVLPTDFVSQYMSLSFNELSDFNTAVSGADIVIGNVNNGNSVDADTPNATPTIDIGTGWNIVVSQGTGADSGTNSVLISNLPSVAQSIDETARSLVSIINQDVLSPVNAFYLSGANDLPGNILLENKSLEDTPFFVAVSDTNPAIGGEFNPELPVVENSLTVATSPDDITKSRVTYISHGLLTGDNIFLSFPNNDAVIQGSFEVTVIDVDNFDIDVATTIPDSTGVISFAVSQTSDNEEKPNRLYYSKLNQPEAVPIVNFIDVGEQDEPIERILALRDNLFILKTDGVYILSGFNSFRVRILDNTAFITAPDTATILNNQIMCLTSQGIATVNSSGVSIISRNIENLVLNFANDKFDFRLKCFAVAYESDRAYILWAPEKVTDTTATQAFRYNIFERTWTRWTVPATCGTIKRLDDKLYIGRGERNFLQKERKCRDRTDHADRDFKLFINEDAINACTVRLSNVTEVEVGDVLIQEQYVTPNFINRLIKKLDDDRGLTDIDYEEIVTVKIGDKIQERLVVLNNKLIADDDGNGITDHDFNSFIDNTQELLDEVNLLVDELNLEITDTTSKNYRPIDGVTCFENVIVQKNRFRNEVVVKYPPVFLQGGIDCYKGINKKIVYNPEHFGNPSIQKQVSKGNIMFDQNNFTDAVVSYSTDLSPSFFAIEVTGNGAGYWNAGSWGDRGSYWGGEGSDRPVHTYIPRPKQRCRYITAQFEHVNAREYFRLVGISYTVRQVSDRAYR